MKRLLAVLMAIVPSCGVLPRPARVPVPSLQAGKANATELVIFLPGRWSRVEEFAQEGFFEIARKRWPDARLTAPDLHLAYYKNQSVARRLQDDVILPARKSGVKTIRIVGISLGGLGALIHEIEYPGQVDELILLSPYLGEEDAIAEIEAAGGLNNWRPGRIAEDDFSRKLWLGLRSRWLDTGHPPRLLLGCGTEDKLAPASRLFAKEFLKPADQQWIRGTHDWPTWRPLFEGLQAMAF